MYFELKEQLKNRLQNETGAYIKRGAKYDFLLAFPNVYKVGMSNLGFHIVYDLLNKREQVFCQRGFLPEKNELAIYKKTKTPLLSLESQKCFCDFDIIGFAISFESDYFNAINMLKMGNIEPLQNKRKEKEPLIIAGGPCVTFNPEPLAAFFDAFVIGEGEVIMPKLMEVYEKSKAKNLTKKEILKEFLNIDGVYVPSFYEHIYSDNGTVLRIENKENAPKKVRRMWVKNLDEYAAHSVIQTKDTEFDLFLTETARGCGRHCRFCMAGYAFRKPRIRSVEKITESVNIAKKFNKRIGLMGAAISDYPKINELCKKILDMDLNMSVASFRADSVTKELVESLSESKVKTLTIAPEAGSKKLRKVINKGIEEEHIFNTINLGVNAGIYNFKLYFMVGLPFEDDEDIDEIVKLTLKIRNFMDEKNAKGLLTLSVNPFVPKPFTPFMWASMTDKKIIKSRIKRIEKGLKKENRIKVTFESPKEAEIQGILARGDKRISNALLIATEKGGAKFFLESLREKNIDYKFYLTREREKNEIFSWETIDIGVKKEYLYNEFLLAKKGEPTIGCFDGCKRCGVCGG